jgi:hypothetical protein
MDLRGPHRVRPFRAGQQRDGYLQSGLSVIMRLERLRVFKPSFWQRLNNF